MTDRKARLAVFLSGGGTGLQALLDACEGGELAAEIVLVVSSRRDAFGLKRAKKAGIATLVSRAKDYDSPEMAADDLFAQLKAHRVDYIVLSGYLRLLPPDVVRTWVGRITNVHPALLPKHGGQGMYGIKVHQAVIDAGDKESGVTVHLVDEIYDHGKILEQARVAVLDDDTPETLAARVLIEEHKLYPKVLQKLIQGNYETED